MSCQHYLETQLKPSIVQQNLEKLLSRADAGMLKEQQLPLVHLPLLVTLIAPHFSGLYCWKVKYVVPAFMCERRRGVLNLPNNMIFILFAAHLWYICCADLMCCLTMCYHCSTSAPSPGECCHCHEGSFCAGFRWFSFSLWATGIWWTWCSSCFFLCFFLTGRLYLQHNGQNPHHSAVYQKKILPGQAVSQLRWGLGLNYTLGHSSVTETEGFILK